MSNKIADNVVRIPTTLDSEFFQFWFKVLNPFHGLTNKETNVIAEFVAERFRLSRVIHDEDILNQVLMSEETKEKIKQTCNVSKSFFNVILTKLRQLNIIIDNKINPRFIPNLELDSKNFKLMLLFEFAEKTN